MEPAGVWITDTGTIYMYVCVYRVHTNSEIFLLVQYFVDLPPVLQKKFSWF